MYDSTAALLRRLRTASLVFGGVVAMGTLGFYAIGRGRWPLFDCFYMTLITLSTVGYGELLQGMNGIFAARVLTISLIVLGSGTLVYFVSTITAFIVEGDLQGILRRRRVVRMIEALEDHVIVCGAGSTGRYVIEELLAERRALVVVELDELRVKELEKDFGVEIPHVIGSAIDDHVLRRAGIERADVVVAALTDDKDNVFVTITARAFNPGARIVAKCVDATAERKLRRAGATSVVSPSSIGGVRMAAEVLRPNAIEFLDRMLRDQGDRKMRISDLAITPGGPLVGRTLAETPIRSMGALVLAARRADGEFEYNPSGNLVLAAGMALIVLVGVEDLQRLRRELVIEPAV